MSKDQSDGGAGWEMANFSIAVPDTLPQELVEADHINLRADRNLAFAHLEHVVASLGIGFGEAQYYRYPLSDSVERQVIVRLCMGVTALRSVYS